MYYFSIANQCFEFLGYILLLCLMSVFLSMVIHIWAILLFLLTFSLLLLVIYLFRFINNYPTSITINPNTCICTSEGIIKSISTGNFFRLSGDIIHIESSIFDVYTHVSPIYGTIGKIIITDMQHTYKNGLYIQINNDNYMIDMIVYSTNNVLNDNVQPQCLVKEGDIVYASQPLCIAVFGANIKICYNHNNKLNINKLYVDQYISMNIIL